MAVRAIDWLDIIQREYLRRFIPNGGSAIKFLVGSNSMIPEVQRQLTSIAEAQEFEFVAIDTAATKLHMIHDVFFAVARRIKWDALAQRWVETIFRSNHYDWHDRENQCQSRSFPN